jgi:hypothetical protein
MANMRQLSFFCSPDNPLPKVLVTKREPLYIIGAIMGGETHNIPMENHTRVGGKLSHLMLKCETDLGKELAYDNGTNF